MIEEKPSEWIRTESGAWTTKESQEFFKKWYEKLEYYQFILWKPEHSIIRDKRSKLKGELVFCEYGQSKRVATGFYDTINKIIYKSDNYKNTWIKPKFAVLIKYHNLMSI